MTSRDALLRAAMHRVIARMGHGVADAAAGLAVLVQDAPDRVRQEWDLFQEEVKAEAERLEREGDGRGVEAERPVGSKTKRRCGRVPKQQSFFHRAGTNGYRARRDGTRERFATHLDARYECRGRLRG